MDDHQRERRFDPICGMWLAPHEIATTLTYIGRTYAFCCDECRVIFLRIPEAHIVRLAHDLHESIGHCCPHQPARMDRAWVRAHLLAPDEEAAYATVQSPPPRSAVRPQPWTRKRTR